MTVKELMEQLKELPPDAEVYCLAKPKVKIVTRPCLVLKDSQGDVVIESD